MFKNGCSWSKVHGQPTPKKAKCDKAMREEHLQAAEEEMNDITECCSLRRSGCLRLKLDEKIKHVSI